MAPAPVPRSEDPATQANYHEIVTEHIHLDWIIDWKEKTIGGSVQHTMRALESTSVAIFDSSYLTINGVTTASGTPLDFDLPPRHKVMGSALKVTLPHELKKGETIDLVISYETTKDCTALGWMQPSQTASGLYPFLYSQCQAIHCRSLVPVQDTPAIKSTYSASVTSPLPILMSALGISPSREEMSSPEIDPKVSKTYTFEQRTPIPSYLIAVAGGELAFAPLGPRTGVWAQPAVLEAATWEFKRDTEKFVSLAEGIASPYSWGRFDMLVLPASFAYGGMENANLTFLTPALVVGDRSEVDVIAHELSHSWFGNLIGCANWQSFWLNESWTTYTERLLTQALHGAAARSFDYIVGRLALDEALKQMSHEPRFQRLHVPYKVGEDPDDGFSTVPYDKGANMLLYLERLVGGLEVFGDYHKAYVQRFSGLSIVTNDWLEHFWQYWSQFPEKEEILRKEFDVDAWLNGEGLELPVKIEYDTSLADNAYDLAARWDSARSQDSFPEFTAADVEGWTSNQVSMLLDTLHKYEPFSESAVEAVQKTYGVNKTSNPEIKLRWLLFALKSGFYKEEAAKWVQGQGRMKYCRPTYKALAKVDYELAKKTFLDAESFYHPIARDMIVKDLGL
ncbi:peptidase family M1-domain-containing protein [Leucosporidium creatinivorum]|uniref:Peptidase family M1-domain-containing protein n=1 Tax=Leucosporidium creatinivorum TaxID=106004 RepID=A0A1Y2FZT4_9BASI|nr:peptidase family M1-domain-containing protein [Leucosporidium creatinivorum]